MVAVRTSGLAFESLIGYVKQDPDGEGEVQCLVTEEYLGLLVEVANDRFMMNTERIRRFEEELFGRYENLSSWEDSNARRTRKKAEGLALRSLKMTEKHPTSDAYHNPESANFERMFVEAN